MGVIIDQVDGEMQDQPASAPPAKESGAEPDAPERELEDLHRKMALIHRRRHRLHAD